MMKLQLVACALLVGLVFTPARALLDDEEDDGALELNKRGIVQDFAEILLARARDKLNAIEANSTLVSNIFEYFKRIYGRSYESRTEERQRLSLFKQRLLTIFAINRDDSLTFDAEINEFSDWTEEEFNNAKKGLDTSDSTGKRRKRDYHDDVLEGVMHKRVASSPTLDWVSLGYVTPVKNQMKCGDCYAFATAAVLEGLYARKNGVLLELSPQQITDCSSLQGNHGCNGGSLVKSVQYFNTIAGRLATWYTYPFTNGVRSCRVGSTSTLTPYRLGTLQYKQVPKGNENSLMEALKQGPIYVAVNAKATAFMSYKSGVINLNAATCSPDKLDHAITLVGYGRDARTGQNYWRLKNSWATTWGENGYIRIARGNNVCGVANNAYQIFTV